MALSGTFTGAGGTAKPGMHYKLQVDWSAQQDIAKNKSSITLKFYLVQNPSWSISIGSRNIAISVDGVAYNVTAPAVGNGGGCTTYLGSCDCPVSHAADGTKSVNISATYQTAPLTVTGVSIPSITAAVDITLDTIPRASTFTPGAGTEENPIVIGEPVTIQIHQAADSFTHTLRYSFGSVSGIIAQNGKNTCQWTPPDTLCAEIPNHSKGLGIIECQTYSGGTRIGSTKSEVWLRVSQKHAPQVSAAYTDISGAHTALDVYARYISTLQGSIEAQGQHGSTITAYSAAVDERSYTGKSFTSSTLIGHGHLVLTVSATDSRGLTGSASYDIWTHAYFLPALTLNASRCREDGTADDTGDHVKITVTGQVCDVNGVNTGTLTVTAGGEQVAALCTSVTPGEDFILEHILPVDTEISLPITATLADKLRSTSRRMTLSIGFVTMDIHAGGKGIGFGAEAPKEGFALGMDTDMCGKRLDGVGVINGALVGAVSADPGTEVKIPLGDTKGVMLVGLCGDAGAYGVYALTFADSATLSTPVQLSGSGVQPQFFVHTPGELTVTGLVGGTTGWYIGMGQPGDH